MEPPPLLNAVEHLKTIIDATPTALVMVDNRGLIQLVNAQTESLFGYPRSQLLGEPVEVLVPHRFRHRHPQQRAGFFNNPEARPMGEGRDLYGRRHDGSEIPIEIGLNPIQTDEGLFVLSAIVDISERKRLESRFRSTVESAPTAMIMIDRSGTIVLANRESANLFGYAGDELLGQTIERLVPPHSAAAHPELRTQYFAQASARRMGEGRDLTALRKDGSEFPVEIGLNPVATDEGTFVLAAIVDLSERRRTIEQLQQAKRALELSNIELQQFAYVASHDLQTPLRAISGYAQCLQADFRDQLGETANLYIQRTVDATERMRRLINDLLSLSRVDSRAKPFVAVDLNDVFEQALTMLALEPGTQDTVKAGTLPCVKGDQSQLMQLLMNLIGNGLKYKSDAPARVEVRARRNNRDWIIDVSDNGIGIAPQHQEQIFDIFKRLHTKSEYPGTGIGLALCRRIVHRHGGNIWVASEPRRGSRFSFNLQGIEDSNTQEPPDEP